ncbi:hypothetical protein EAH75_13510 [Rhodanobacter glycinis]|uniref:Uncharacterized protein n=1 Tax=Rhodanobacter glycinis TaxID=582702 RepID=A0A502C6T5_9GAMM|nr:hypothetical protein EAH88_10300 [Rhodanobacter glycinis]TPG47819.1 hypothetical protein EAH75_13510 [Rhodanobacter glycinis]
MMPSSLDAFIVLAPRHIMKMAKADRHEATPCAASGQLQIGTWLLAPVGLRVLEAATVAMT